MFATNVGAFALFAFVTILLIVCAAIIVDHVAGMRKRRNDG